MSNTIQSQLRAMNNQSNGDITSCMARYIANQDKILDGSQVNDVTGIKKEDSLIVNNELEEIMSSIKPTDRHTSEQPVDDKNNDQSIAEQPQRSFVSDFQRQQTVFQPRQQQQTVRYNLPTIKQETERTPVETTKNEEDEKIRKMEILKKLFVLSQNGVTLSQNYNINSNLELMEHEYNLQTRLIKRTNAVKSWQSITIGLATGVEYLNTQYDPFGINLKGWSQVLSADIDNYKEVFGELHDKYFRDTSCPPELKLVTMLTMSAVQFHIIGTKFKTIPNLKSQIDDLKNHPKSNTSDEMNRMNKESAKTVLKPPELPDDVNKLLEKSQTLLSSEQQTYNLDELSTTSNRRKKKVINKKF